MPLEKSLIYLISVLYLLIGVVLIFNNPPALSSDMFFYYSIARKYSLGEFYHALNGYWAPLMPWLVALFFKVGVFWYALPLVNLIGGFLLVLYTVKIASLLKLSTLGTWALTLLNAALAIAHQLDTTTPDFLSAVFLVIFMYYYFQNDLQVSSKEWIKTAIAALLMIFCKVFYFYFIVVVFVLEAFFGLYKEKRQFFSGARGIALMKQTAVVVGVYMIWVLALSVKYDKFVFSTTGSYNSTIGTPTGNAVQYYTYSGLTAPKSIYSLGTEDPTYASVKARKPFESKEAFDYQMGIFEYNFRILNYLFRYFSYFRWFVLLIPIGLLFFGYFPERNVAIKIFLMGCLILFGYFLVFYEDRYVTPVLFCFVFTAFYFFDKIDFYRNIFVNTFLLILPLIAFGKNTIDVVKIWQSHLSSYAEARKVSGKLVESNLFEGKKIANASDAYGGTYLSMLALEGSAQYYGELGMYHTNEQNWEDLKMHQIEYLFYFDCSKINEQGTCMDFTLPFYLADKKIVYSDSSTGMKVYKLF